ncbi:RluA family pseudouridine synthase [Candidatus Gracilibacteria bacterium]|nr:RluA family pseudouridine synthase [Candidatus Gracilibacteria bacterium]
MKKTFTITEKDNGRKIFKIIKDNFKELQLGDIQKIFRQKDVKINGKRVKQDEIAKKGDEISIFIGGEMEKNFEKNKKFLEKTGKILDKNKKNFVSEKNFQENFKIIFEDEEILVADKPAGIAVHPGSNHPEGKTMICFAKYYLEKKNPGGDNFIQLAHRLDADTSGVLLFAKKSETLRKINEMIKKRKVEKKYFALIKGEIREKSGKIICLVKRTDGKNGDKVILAKKGDKNALISQTNFKIIKTFSKKIGDKIEKFSLMDLNIKTGRMHQIRVHMKSKGTPLIMDQIYGDFKFNKIFQKEIGLKRHFLHSYFFEITHPTTGKKIKFKLKISDDLKKCLKNLA